MASLVIESRFCGPPGTGHGGYVAGRLASYLDTPAVVRLKRPVPLDRPLEVVAQYYGGVELIDHDPAGTSSDPTGAEGDVAQPAGGFPAGEPTVVAVAERRAPLAVDPPGRVSLDQAHAAAARFGWGDPHLFPRCFGCGSDRDPGDGWRVMGGPTEDGQMVAAPAVCPPNLVDPSGLVPVEQVWAALDCITGQSLQLERMELPPPWLLGQLSVDVLARVSTSEPLVVASWPEDLDGRRWYSAGAMWSGNRLVAVASATWIQLKPS